MFCTQCGAEINGTANFCGACGVKRNDPVSRKEENPKAGLVGFSSKINDPAFAGYIKSSNRYAAIFSFGLAIAAVIGFGIYGETSSEMDNPEAIYIGLGIGGMFILIALFQIMGRKRGKTWDGAVVDKKVAQKRRRRNTSGNDYYWQDYLEYTVFITSDQGKKHVICVEDDDTLYNYYQVGDRVRHHKGINSYEKYDKSKDDIIFCNACASKNDIKDDFCFRCNCPLLK